MLFNSKYSFIFFFLTGFSLRSPYAFQNKYHQDLHRERRNRHPQVMQTVAKNKKWVSGFENIRYMCGTIQVPYDIPIGWLARDGPLGTSNQTLYERRYRMVPLCCEGYARNEEDICVPSCKGGCKNGWCLRPNVCDCAGDHVLNNLGHCVPCACVHGTCVDGACVCDEHYELDAESLTCKPVCNYTCENADCVAPNTCKCRPGYKESAHITNFCIPHCTNDCINGQCTAPDVCICDSGYYFNNEFGICFPRCNNCEDGVCLQPNLCVCYKGFKRENNTCVPTCNGRCMNGYCTANDTCVCDTGYEKFERYTCLPTCRPACINGWCKMPNYCECEDGYVQTSDPSRCQLSTTAIAYSQTFAIEYTVLTISDVHRLRL